MGRHGGRLARCRYGRGTGAHAARSRPADVHHTTAPHPQLLRLGSSCGEIAARVIITKAWVGHPPSQVLPPRGLGRCHHRLLLVNLPHQPSEPARPRPCLHPCRAAAPIRSPCACCSHARTHRLPLSHAPTWGRPPSEWPHIPRPSPGRGPRRRRPCPRSEDRRHPAQARAPPAAGRVASLQAMPWQCCPAVLPRPSCVTPCAGQPAWRARTLGPSVVVIIRCRALWTLIINSRGRHAVVVVVVPLRLFKRTGGCGGGVPAAQCFATTHAHSAEGTCRA